jgi:hypothetical protein
MRISELYISICLLIHVKYLSNPPQDTDPLFHSFLPKPSALSECWLFGPDASLKDHRSVALQS